MHFENQMIKTLAERAAIPVPKVYIIPEQTPNAFATGRNPKNASVIEEMRHPAYPLKLVIET